MPNIFHPQARFVSVSVGVENDAEDVCENNRRIQLQTENILQRAEILIEQLFAAGFD